MSGPLTGLTVIEMGAIGPVPLAGQLMADLGAKVIIIDRKSTTTATDDINRRNKQSVAINLKHGEGSRILLRLLETADMLIEGFRPGVMEKLNIGPDDCHQVNSALIYGRMTGWGQQGPLSQCAGHDINYLALTGALNAIGSKGAPPVPPLNLVADYAGGAMFLVMGVLAALHERNLSGKGQVIDAAMIDGVPSVMGFIQNLFHNNRWSLHRQSNMLDGGAPYYRCYRTADNLHMAVGAIEPQFFKLFLALAGLPESDTDIQHDQQHWPEMHKRYEALFQSKTRDAWTRIFENTDACVSPVLDFDEATAHEHNRERGVFCNDRFEATPAPRFDRTPAAQPTRAVAQGANTDRVLQSLGIDKAEIRKLRGTGALT